MLENYVGVVCSKSRKEIYCLEGSYEYKKKFQDKDFDVIYISFFYLRNLISKEPNISKWNIYDILKLKNSF